MAGGFGVYDGITALRVGHLFGRKSFAPILHRH